MTEPQSANQAGGAEAPPARLGYRHLIDVARGQRPADAVVRGGLLVDVHTRRVRAADVAIAQGAVAAVGDVEYTRGPETAVVDAGGRYVVPGLIEQHVHTYESHLSIFEYAAAVLPRGTTTIVTDFYGETVVAGPRAARLQLDFAAATPLRCVFVLPLPAYYQNGVFGHTGTPTMQDLKSMLHWPECRGINDTFAARIVAQDDALLDLVAEALAQGKHICGHASEISGRSASAWVAYVGDTDDHECVTAEEAVEKAQLGVWISMRQGSGCYNIPSVARAITQYGADARRFTLCTDLLSPLELAANGHIDHCVRVAIASGIDPLTAVQMATLNAAECMGIAGQVGSITPGRAADMLLVDDLRSFQVETVLARGRVVARHGEMAADLGVAPYPHWARDTVHLAGLRQEAFEIGAPPGADRVTVRVIGASGVSLITDERTTSIATRAGMVPADPGRDILKIASVERFSGRAELGVGFVQGFGLRRGAIAGTYNPQHQDLIVVGVDSRDMFVAAKAIEQMGGGFAVVAGGEVRAALPLPIFGLLADQTLAAVVKQLQSLYAAARDLGCQLPAPFHTLAFVGLPVDIGTLKISPKGVVHVWKGETVPVVIA